MKKLFVLSFVVLFALVGAQAFASPPVKPPVEGFLIETTTDIIVDGSMSESQRFNWIYWEGWGTGPFFPNGYGTAACLDCGINTGPGYPDTVLNTQGFSEGAQIVYQQDFEAIDGVTTFKKDFWASSTANADGNNLVVDKTIIYDQTPGGSGFAKHTEKLGLSVVSAGSAGGAGANDGIVSILTLCPWGNSGGGTGPGTPGYPPTNEGIAAGSEFNVTNINFTSNSAVSSTVNPYLSYAVTGDGIGTIKAGFVVELWEGPENYVYKMTPWTGLTGAVPTTCWVPPTCPPPLASRTSYSEHASADGVWTFNKAVKYTSIMPPSVAGATSNPIGNVP